MLIEALATEGAAAIYCLASALLVAAGVAKLTTPRSAAHVLHALRVPLPEVSARLLGVIEIVAGASALATARPLASLSVAILYTAFTSVLIAALLGKLSIQSCGCAGSVDVPPTWLHAVLNITAVAASIYASYTSVSVLNHLESAGYLAIPALIGLASAAYVAFAIVTYEPTLFASTTQSRAS